MAKSDMRNSHVTTVLSMCGLRNLSFAFVHYYVRVLYTDERFNSIVEHSDCFVSFLLLYQGCHLVP